MFFLSLLDDEGIVLDIGANIGIMSVHFARKLRNAIVFAFEPIPHNIRALKKVIAFYKLKNVQIFETALGDKNGEASMVMPVLNKVKMQGLSHVLHESINDFNEGEEFKTPIIMLDDISDINESEKKVQAIKMDVENFEYFVLKGGTNLIRKHKPLIYSELWDNDNRERCFELMSSLGYRIQYRDGKKLVDFDPAIHTSQNFFFIPAH